MKKRYEILKIFLISFMLRWHDVKWIKWITKVVTSQRNVAYLCDHFRFGFNLKRRSSWIPKKQILASLGTGIFKNFNLCLWLILTWLIKTFTTRSASCAIVTSNLKISKLFLFWEGCLMKHVWLHNVAYFLDSSLWFLMIAFQRGQ